MIEVSVIAGTIIIAVSLAIVLIMICTKGETK